MDEFDTSPPSTSRASSKFGQVYNPPPTPRLRLRRLPTSPIDGFAPFISENDDMDNVDDVDSVDSVDPVDDDENIDMYTVTDESNKSCYSTPGVLDTVYTISHSE